MPEQERTYICCDMKSFYASVECVARKLDPLKANLLVADESRTDKTICLAVSPALKAIGVPSRPRLFEAKERIRQFEAISHTKVDYIIAPPRMGEYIRVSSKIYEIFRKYVADCDAHVYSIDELFIDVTPYLHLYREKAEAVGVSPAHYFAITMIQDILKHTGITATVGIGTNLYLAKVGMDIVAKKAQADKDGVRIVREAGSSLDGISAVLFVSQMDAMLNMIDQVELPELPLKQRSRLPQCKIILCDELRSLAQKVRLHPDIYGVSLEETRRKSLLDALYEEGIIPTYSFPKDVVSTYIENEDGQIDQQVERGLEIAISEYAPGRSIVVNKETYVIGGIYCHTDNPKYGRQASDYLQDPNYVKKIVQCGACDWFGFPDDTENGKCPFCHSKSMIEQRDMLRPWGFSPMNGRPVSATMVDDVYSYSETPIYSTLPKEEDMLPVDLYSKLSYAIRENQRIILTNRGRQDKGFTICCDCGAAVPGDDGKALAGMKRPGNNNHFACSHTRTKQINLGYDFITDMLVLTIELPKAEINTESLDGKAWLKRACITLAEALRKAATLLLDIEFNEVQAGYRIRFADQAIYADIYLYDSLSSGAGYCAQIGEMVGQLLQDTHDLLNQCDCRSACQNCLKHYQNQRIQMHLDRFSALKLLYYGQTGTIPAPLTIQKQHEAVRSFSVLFEKQGLSLELSVPITISKGLIQKELIIHHAMEKKKSLPSTAKIFISEEALQNAKPYAMKTIMEAFF